MPPLTLMDRHVETKTDIAFFLLDQNGQTRVYGGCVCVWLWRNHDFPTEDDDLEIFIDCYD